MGYYIRSLLEFDNEWVKNHYNVFSFFLATDLNSLDSSQFHKLLNDVHKQTGEKTMCYFFIPQNWKIPRKDYQEGGIQNRYDLMDFVREGENLNKFKQAIKKGTRAFADYILKEGITDFLSIEKMGLLFFGKKEDLLKKNEIIYVPLSESEYLRSEQFKILFPWFGKNKLSDWDYIKYYNYLVKKEEKIWNLLKERPRKIWIERGLQIVQILLQLSSLLAQKIL